MSNGDNKNTPCGFDTLKHFCETPILAFLSSSYGSRLSRSQCFLPWARWKATCSSVSTRQLCTKNWRTKLAGCATFALSCRSSSWWRATAAKQSACWTPKLACSSARVRRHQFNNFSSKLKWQIIMQALTHITPSLTDFLTVSIWHTQ